MSSQPMHDMLPNKKSLYRHQCPRDQKSERRLILAIATIQPGVKSGFVAGVPVWRGSRDKRRHLQRIRSIRFAEQARESLRFDAHHRNIDAHEQRQEGQTEDPAPSRNRKPETDKKTAQVEWVTGIGVRP